MSNELFTLDLVKQRHSEYIEHARQDRLARESGFRPLWQRIAARLTGERGHTERTRPAESEAAA